MSSPILDCPQDYDLGGTVQLIRRVFFLWTLSDGDVYDRQAPIEPSELYAGMHAQSLRKGLRYDEGIVSSLNSKSEAYKICG
jgi:hypothetical protein